MIPRKEIITHLMKECISLKSQLLAREGFPGVMQPALLAGYVATLTVQLRNIAVNVEVPVEPSSEVKDA